MSKPYKNTIALIYDFDGTLSPKPMQEYTILPEIGIKSKKFWDAVKKENMSIQGEEIITYMMKLLRMADSAQVPITRQIFSKLAKNIKYYPGVKDFFKRINEFVKKESNGEVKIKHYIISSGLKEILCKLNIHKEFKNIFASEYHFDHTKNARHPKLVITDTVKTQFLFRINKGKEKLSESINEHMPEYERPIPFSNMIYIGDGMTDVPCMTVTHSHGGYPIAVYKKGQRRGLAICMELFKHGRVEFIAPADYRKNQPLEKCIQTTIKTIIQGIIFQKAQYEHMQGYIRKIRA